MNIGFIQSSGPILEQDIGLLGEEENERRPMTHEKRRGRVESS